MDDFTKYVFIFAAFAFPVIFWCGLMVLIGRLTGWIALAQKYRATESFQGKCWYFQHAQFRWSMNYSGALIVGANAEGLYISALPPFRMAHPSLFIPWTDMRLEMKHARFRGNYVEIHFSEVPGVLIRFSAR